ncbi:MAG: hypothetical protein GY862_08565 [Gammaproteobacteria bacterium]|nr:hypothetical protein [Gammaproteobacteria bacterium]
MKKRFGAGYKPAPAGVYFRRTGFATPSGTVVLQAGIMKKRFGAGYKPAPAGMIIFCLE